MTTIQEQYSELIKQGQDASRVAIETWTQTFQQAAGQLSRLRAASARTR